MKKTVAYKKTAKKTGRSPDAIKRAQDNLTLSRKGLGTQVRLSPAAIELLDELRGEEGKAQFVTGLLEKEKRRRQR